MPQFSLVIRDSLPISRFPLRPCLRYCLASYVQSTSEFIALRLSFICLNSVTRGVHSPLSQWCILHIPNQISTKIINFLPIFGKFVNFPSFSAKFINFPLFSFNLRFLLYLCFLLAPYVDHDAFVNIHVLDAPACNHSNACSWWRHVLNMRLLSLGYWHTWNLFSYIDKSVDLLLKEFLAVPLHRLNCGATCSKQTRSMNTNTFWCVYQCVYKSCACDLCAVLINAKWCDIAQS